MSIYEKIYDIFVEKLGNPGDISLLEDYIKFVLENQTCKNLNVQYCENHHIIPRCLYENDYLFTLTYENHVAAHLKLAEAYPINMFMRPLNFMLSSEHKEDPKYKQILSEARKNAWVEFKKSESYPKFVEKQRIICSNNMFNGKAKYMSDLFLNNPEARKRHKISCNESWTIKRRKEISEKLREYNKIHGTQRFVDAMNKRYNEMTETEYQKFVDTMSLINRNPIKRSISGRKIKDHWANNTTYITKMKARKTRGSCGKKTKALWETDEHRIKVLTSRKLTYIKKNIPDRFDISDLSDKEILEQFSEFSKKENFQYKNEDLKNRDEVLVIKAYKKKYRIRNDLLTGRGWYRKSSDHLRGIIISYVNKYNILDSHKDTIERILNEAH